MKKIICVLVIFFSMVAQSEVRADLSNAVSSVVSTVVSTGKDVIRGIKDGIDSGRKDGKSIDEAFLINDKDQFEKNIKANVLALSKTDNGYKVTVALKNETEKMVRLTNLHEKKALQLIDTDGFVVFSQGPFDDINIPKQTAVKSHFFFDTDGTPKILKIYESEITISNEIISAL